MRESEGIRQSIGRRTGVQVEIQISSHVPTVTLQVFKGTHVEVFHIVYDMVGSVQAVHLEKSHNISGQ